MLGYRKPPVAPALHLPPLTEQDVRYQAELLAALEQGRGLLVQVPSAEPGTKPGEAALPPEAVLT